MNQSNRALQIVEKKHLHHLTVKSATSNIDVPPRYGKGFREVAPNELLHIDITPTNVELVSDVTGVPMRYAIVAAIDVYSHCIGAIDIFPSATSVDIATILFESLWPKRAEHGWPDIAESQYAGAPARLVIAANSAFDDRRDSELANMPALRPERVGHRQRMVNGRQLKHQFDDRRLTSP